MQGLDGLASASGVSVDTFRGAYDPTQAYYKGDIVVANGQLWKAPANMAAIPAASFVGEALITNGSAKTTSTVCTLPTGSKAGDTVLILTELHPVATVSGNLATSNYTPPAYGTSIDLGVQTYVNAAGQGVYAARSYTLTGTDISAGTLTIPAQTNANNGSSAVLDMIVLTFRDAIIQGVGDGSINSGTGITTYALISNTLPAWPAGYAFAVGAAFVGAGQVETGAWSNPSPISNWNTSDIGTVRGFLAACYYSTGAGTGAPTFTATQSSGGLSAICCQYGVVSTSVFNSANWTFLFGDQPGQVEMFGFGTAPSGYLACDGSAVNRLAYASLFAAIGTNYGVGDGATTFNVPLMTNNFPVGNTPGATGGASTHTHTSAAHTHTEAAHTHPLSSNGIAQIIFDSSGLGMVLVTNSFTDTRSKTVAGALSSGTGRSSGAALAGTTDSTTPGATGSTTPGATGSASSLPPFVGFAFFIKT